MYTENKRPSATATFILLSYDRPKHNRKKENKGTYFGPVMTIKLWRSFLFPLFLDRPQFTVSGPVIKEKKEKEKADSDFPFLGMGAARKSLTAQRQSSLFSYFFIISRTRTKTKRNYSGKFKKEKKIGTCLCLFPFHFLWDLMLRLWQHESREREKGKSGDWAQVVARAAGQSPSGTYYRSVRTA